MKKQGKKLTFKEKVLAMSAKEIIMAMVEGLKHPTVKLQMNTFGYKKDGICYGCAATNAVCYIAGKNYKWAKENYGDRLQVSIEKDVDFVEMIEYAIDDLRIGDIHLYNIIANRIGIATISSKGLVLPTLSDSNYLLNLPYYIELANRQENENY
jgi:hypothetical protein